MEQSRYLAGRAEMSIENPGKKWGGISTEKRTEKKKRQKGNSRKREKQVGETPVMSQTFLATTFFTQ